MVLESTMICFDNSDYQRNGDYYPSRLEVQKDAVNVICRAKISANVENSVGILTLSGCTEVLVTLTSDVGKLFAKLHPIQPKGEMNLLTGVRIAHLVLKHRQSKNHKMRIVAFVGSPIDNNNKDELVKLGKRLKKEKVNVDVVSFGEHGKNDIFLRAFVEALNGKEGTGSSLLSIPRGANFNEALISSPVIVGEDGLGGAGLSMAAFEFGVDPNDDPDLVLALRISMEEQRQRQEEELILATAAENGVTAGTSGNATAANTVGADLSCTLGDASADNLPNFADMTEEEQIAFALQMSMTESPQAKRLNIENPPAAVGNTPMEVDEEINTNPAYLQNVLENLPGVDPQSEEVRTAVESLAKTNDPEAKDEKAKDGNKKEHK